MGYNSTMVIMNDSLDAISDDKEFGRKVNDACMTVTRGKPVDISCGGHVNAATVVESAHATFHSVIIVGGNHAIVTGAGAVAHGYRSQEDITLDALKSFADKLGYTLRKKPSKKK